MAARSPFCSAPHHAHHLLVLFLFTLVLTTAGCTQAPDVRRARHLDRGQRYAQQGKLAEAVIEFRNAVQAQPRDGEARLTLADAYWKAADFRSAADEYVRAADLLPLRVDVQLKAGNVLLFGGRFDDAKVRADKALAVAPKNIQAHILLANALGGLRQLDAAIAGIEEAIRLSPESSAAYATLGSFETTRGQHEAAERAFKKAVELDARSAPAHLSLAAFYWARQRLPEMEQALQRALEVEPANVLAHRAMGSLALGTNRPAQAEKHLKRVVDLTGSSAAILALADFYIGRKDSAAARAALQRLSTSRDAAAEAGVRLALLDHEDGRPDAAYRRLDEVLVGQPTHLRALITRSAMLLSDRRAHEALDSAQLAVKSHPDAAAALFTLARVQQARREPEAAIAAYREVLRVNPGAAGAQAAIAQLHLSRGRPEQAVGSAEDALKNAPSHAEARLALVRGLMAGGDLQRAETEMKELLARFPDSSSVRAQNGLLLKRRKDLAGARREFEHALKLTPGSVMALEGLVSLDVAANKPEAARARVVERISRSDASTAMLMLGARTYIATGSPREGEQLLRRIQQKDPTYLDAYTALGQLYMRQRRLAEALAEFESLAQRHPNSVAALTTAGMILQAQGRIADARQRYERALQLDSSAPVAANNLAWLHVSSGGNLDVALQLAQAAYGRLPHNPQVTDTLGYIYFKKNLIPQALPLLRTTVEQEPHNPLFHYHLGLALAKSGDSGTAQEHLSRALSLNPGFEGAADARTLLQTLSSDGQFE